MSSNALVQTRIDAEVKARATEVLEHLGLTLSDAVRILLTRIAHEGALPMELTADPQKYDAWFRNKVMEALNDSRPPLADEQVKSHFAQRRAAALHKAGTNKA